MKSINLWELITEAARGSGPNAGAAKELVEAVRDGPNAFGSELTLAVEEGGTWTVDIFHHENHVKRVTLVVSPTGALKVTRVKEYDGLLEIRSVDF